MQIANLMVPSEKAINVHIQCTQYQTGTSDCGLYVRHEHLLYIPSLAFLNYYAPINVDVFVECGMWETFRLFSGS